MGINNLVRQQDQSDCGVSCLASIIRFHGGNSTLEHLRELSGTSKSGTTLLGLINAAKAEGFVAEGLQAESVENLRELTHPAILHVILENKLQHYVVFYGFTSTLRSKQQDTLIIGDPGKGIMKMSVEELNNIWSTKVLLKLEPTEKFQKSKKKIANRNKWVAHLIGEEIALLLVSLFLGILISLLGISTAILSQKLIDDILPKESTEKLVLSLVFVTLLLLARSGLGYMRGLFMVKQSQSFNNRIIQSFYNSLLLLPKSFFDNRRTGDIVSRMNDTRRIQSVISTIFGTIIMDLLVVMISFSFAFAYSFLIGIILISSLPVHFLILYSFNKPVVEAQRETMAGYAMAESNFIDSVQGVIDIKLLNKQTFFGKMNAIIYAEFQKKIAALAQVNIKFSLVSEVSGVFFMISIFAVASWLVISKEMKLGEMVAVISLAGSVLPSINRIVISNIQIQEAIVAFDRMFEFTSMKTEVALTNTKMKFSLSQLTVQDITFRFPGRRQVLNELSLQLYKGQITALMGESGHGKSTFLQVLQKFYEPESGLILADGIDLQSIDAAAWRSQIGSIQQEPKIFNGTLLYNISLSDSEEECRSAILFCKETGFDKYFTQFPHGYSTVIGEAGINLSGGQRQLVVFSRVLFRRPKLLLLDEATSAMDRSMENFILGLLEKDKKERITLLVTHRIKTTEQCDRILILENGSIINSGTPEELLKISELL